MSELMIREREDLSQFMPAGLSDKLRMSEVLYKSGLMPQHFKSPAQVMVALQMGHELGLKPMVAINNISVINGRPTLGADIQAALIRQHPEYAGIEIEETADSCTVTIRRKVGPVLETFRSTFSDADAKRAGLAGKSGPWQQYPKRMRKHRALAYACRDAFPDVLAGVYEPDEMHAIQHEPVNITEIAHEVIEGDREEEQSAPEQTVSEEVPATDWKAAKKAALEELAGVMAEFDEREKEKARAKVKGVSASEGGVKFLTALCVEYRAKARIRAEEEGNGHEQFVDDVPYPDSVTTIPADEQGALF
jgi:hypothetical protein